MLYTHIFSSQNTGAIILTIGIIAILGVFAALFIQFSLQQRHTEYVVENSLLLKNLDSLNQKYYFHTFQNQYLHVKTLHSKSAYDKTRFSDILNDFVLSHETIINENIYFAENNTRTYRMYCNECDKLRKENNYSADYYQNGFFKEIEDKLFYEKKKKPATKFEVVILKQYTSPQGRNHYEDRLIYSADQIQKAMSRAKEQAEHQKAQASTRQAERTKMTEALRYEILKRDNGRCRICGASADDGVKLHVDHIRPVSKGGKTEPSNLRTLCDRCNFGKGAKYDPNGYN